MCWVFYKGDSALTQHNPPMLYHCCQAWFSEDMLKFVIYVELSTLQALWMQGSELISQEAKWVPGSVWT